MNDAPIAAPSRGLRLIRVVDLGSFRRQLVVSTAALSTLVALAMVLAVQFFLAGSAIDSVDRILDDRSTALITAIRDASSGDRIVVPSADLDPGVAVYDSSGAIVAGSVPPRLAHEYDELSTTDRRRTHQLGDAFELMARPFKTKSGTTGVMVMSERLAPYEDDEHDALGVSIVAALLLVVVATALAAWASRRALAPVAQMARTAEEWSAHDLDRRFDLGPPTNEIMALGHTLDGLLDKVARAITTEQRLTSELAHELRTPLTAVQGNAELIAMRTDLDPQVREDVAEIIESCHRMASTVTSLLELARAQSTARSGATCELRDVLADVVAHAHHPERVRIELDRPVSLAVPAEVAVRAIAPLVDNATRLAEEVVLSASVSGSHASVRVADDGPGVPADEAIRIFEAGHTGGDGSGLGLALARRIARSVGGDVTLAEADGGRGATFVVTLPVA